MVEEQLTSFLVARHVSELVIDDKVIFLEDRLLGMQLPLGSALLDLGDEMRRGCEHDAV